MLCILLLTTDKFYSEVISTQGGVIAAGIAVSVIGGYAGWGIAVGLGLSNPIGWGIAAGTILEGYIFFPDTSKC